MVWFVNASDGALVGQIMDSGPQYIGSSLHVFVEPPQCPPGSWPMWSGDGWSCAVDFRGSVWHRPGSQDMIVIYRLGQLPEGDWIEGPPQAMGDL